MKWNHLPVAGGLYDQHPDLLEQFQYIFAQRAKHEEMERRKEEANSRGKKGVPRTAGSRRRR